MDLKISLLSPAVARALRGERNLSCMAAEAHKLDEEHAAVSRQLRTVERQRLNLMFPAGSRDEFGKLSQRRAVLDRTLLCLDRMRVELMEDTGRVRRIALASAQRPGLLRFGNRLPADPVREL